MDEDVRQRFEALEKRIEAVEAPRAPHPAPVAEKEKSLGEFLAEKKPKSVNEKSRAMGYFLERYKGYKSFTSDDILKSYQSAKEPVPVNVPDTLTKNVKQRYMMDAAEPKNGKKAWTMTTTGIKDVESGFKGTEQ
jgi:hypothetical protein